MNATMQWLTAPAAHTLPPGSLQIWRASLDACSDSLARYTALLHSQELARANRFVLPGDRRRFIASRATLRLLLARYLEIPPNSVRIDEGPQGKPYVATSEPDFELKFNLSHSQGIAVYAFTGKKEIGIDVEKIRHDYATREIAEQHFSKREIAELNALPSQFFPGGFFRCWTRKEAYIKARGQGLQIPLDSFSVNMAEESSPELIATDSARWSMYSFVPFPEFVAAVVVEKSDWALSFYDSSDLL